MPEPRRLIEQYFRPVRACGTPCTTGKSVLFHVQQPSVSVKVAPEPPQVSVAETELVGKVAYAPGSETVNGPVTLPPLIVAVNIAGELVVV